MTRILSRPDRSAWSTRSDDWSQIDEVVWGRGSKDNEMVKRGAARPWKTIMAHMIPHMFRCISFSVITGCQALLGMLGRFSPVATCAHHYASCRIRDIVASEIHLLDRRSYTLRTSTSEPLIRQPALRSNLKAD
ncbi:hypothetical protein AFLA_000457 [Aspergillus flavus NRRL3357]|nr:hypothetical protein AFLA_000457 [Aspergillus flavus NRRL3357]